jgi:hypothetical protein
MIGSAKASAVATETTTIGLGERGDARGIVPMWSRRINKC